MPIRAKLPDGRVVTVPDDTSPDELDAIVNREAGPDEPRMATSRAPQRPSLTGVLKDAAFSAAPLLWPAGLLSRPETLPTIGGTAGAMLGGPFGAAAGGAGGAALRDMIQAGVGDATKAPKSGLEAATNVGLNAAGQGLLTKGGDLVSKGLASGAKKLYTGLLKPKDATLENFPTVIDDLIKEGRLITPGSRAAVVGEQRAVGAQKGRILDAADATGRTVPRGTIRSGLDEVLDESIKSSPRPVKDMNKLAEIERELIPDEPTILPSRAERLGSQLQSEAARGFRQTKTGARINDLPMRSRMAVAGKAKEAVRAIAPEIGPVNARYASLKGQSEALRHALKREGNTSLIGMRDIIGGGLGGVLGSAGGPGGASAGGAAGVALMRLLAQPRTGSMAAIAGNRLSKAQLDQAVRAAMLALSQEQE